MIDVRTMLHMASQTSEIRGLQSAAKHWMIPFDEEDLHDAMNDVDLTLKLINLVMRGEHIE